MLEDDKLKDVDKPCQRLFFLIKEENFSVEAMQLIQNQIKEYIRSVESCTKEEITAIVEDIIEQYNGTLVPFELYIISY